MDTDLDPRLSAWLDRMSEIYEAHELGVGLRPIGEVIAPIVERVRAVVPKHGARLITAHSFPRFDACE